MIEGRRSSPTEPPTVYQLAWTVARDVNRTLGGGIASMELLRRTFVNHGWLRPAEHALLVAVSRLTPGTTVLAYCVALGWHLKRVAGSVAALLAGSMPAAVFVSLLAALLVRVDRYSPVQMLLLVGMLIAAVLVFSTAWHLVKPYAARYLRARMLVIAGASVAMLALQVSPVRILLVAAALGALWGPPQIPQPPAAAAGVQPPPTS